MKKITLLSLLALCLQLSSFGQANFYSIIDSLYTHDSSLTAHDSLKNGIQKEVDRMNLLLAPRLAPHGDFSVAATAFNGYVAGFNNQGASSTACGIEATTWREEGPYDRAVHTGGGNGQINRITYDPRFNTTVNGDLNQTIYAGSFWGGLWKTTDNGANWSNLNTDFTLPQTSVSGIAVSHQNPENHLFISTGNGDLLDFRHPLYSGNGNGVPTSVFTSGVYRSTDGGNSWQAINSGFIGTTNISATTSDIMIDPTDEKILYLVASNGLYKCTNALSPTPTWIKLNTPSNMSEKFSSLRFHPTNSQIIYASSDELIKSTDGGATWTKLTGAGTSLDLTNLPMNSSSLAASFKPLRMKLAVSPAAPDRIYMYVIGNEMVNKNGNRVRLSSRYIYRLENGNWTQLLRNTRHPGSYVDLISTSYMGFAVSPVDPEIILYGSVKVGILYTSTDPLYVYDSPFISHNSHDDVHDIVFEPNATQTPDFMVAHHGGISQSFVKLPPYPTNYKYSRLRSNGINTSMLWGLDISKIDPQRMVMGRQDNGAHKSNDGAQSWSVIFTGQDGYGVGFGNEAKSLQPELHTKGNENILQAGTPTLSPYIIANPSTYDHTNPKAFIPANFKNKEHPTLNTTIFGFDDLWSDYDATGSIYLHNNWKIQSDIYDSPIFAAADKRRVLDFEIATSNTDYVYVVTYSQDGSGYYTNLHKSTTGLKNNVYNFPNTSFTKKFNDISANLPTVNYNGTTYLPAITGIAVSKIDHLKVWITLSGYHNNQKIYRSDDGGQTWVNADPNQCLPNLPTNAIIYQNGTDDRLYLAMDNGIYVSDNTDNNWKQLGADFPKVMTHQLLINECANRLYVGTYGRGIWSTELLPATQELSEQKITTNTTWNENRIIEANLLIEAPAKLTITSTIYMPTEGKIIVEPGAELEIDGGTITNSCGKSWYGIIVHGDKNLPQTATNQGTVRLKNNALLDNVAYAISFRDEDEWNLSGGLVEAEDATFRVSRRAVEFMSYPNYINNSYFKRCTFEYVTSISETPLSLVTLWDNKGVSFYGCTFKDETDLNKYYEHVGNGIFSIDASYQVLPDCNDPAQTSPCGSRYLTRSSFSNFNQGIYATGSGGLNTIKVDQTDFTDNSMACRIKALNNVSFTRNTVLTGNIEKDGYILNNTLNPYKYQMGLYSKDASGYEVEQNIFEERSTAKENVNGINIINSGEDNNEVYNNTFKNNTVGQKYDKINRQLIQLRSHVGLQFLCNKNTINNRTDVQINDDGIRRQQGNSTSSAANLFSTSVINNGHIDNQSPQLITYYYNQNVSQENPVDHTSGLVNPSAITSSNACATRIMSIAGNHPTPHLNAYYQNRQQYDALLYTYHQNMDGGNTDSLLEIIQLSIPGEAQQLRDQLMAEAPYVSADALWEAAGSGILTDALLLEICLANPEATMNEAFLNYVEFEIPNPLPANMVQLIYLNWSTETPRTLLEGLLGDYSMDLGRANSQLLHFYAMDSLDWKDSIKSLLTSKKSLISLYQLVELEMQQENYNAALAQLTQIANNHDLSPRQEAEHLNLKALINFKASIQAAGQNYLQLEEAQLSQLRQMAEANTGRSSTLASNILCFGYGECLQEAPEPQERKKARRVYSNIISQEIDKSMISISPNPSSDMVTLSGVEMDNAKGETLTFHLFSMEGKEIMQKELRDASTQINLTALAQGTYVYRIFKGGIQLSEGTLVKQ